MTTGCDWISVISGAIVIRCPACEEGEIPMRIPEDEWTPLVCPACGRETYAQSFRGGGSFGDDDVREVANG